MKFSEINASQIYFWLKDVSGCKNFLSKIRGFIKLQKSPCETFFSICDVKYFFNKRTVTKTLRNTVKQNWTSTRKTKKKNFLGFILQDITHWNHKNVRNCYFWWYNWGSGTQCGIQWFFMILWISESFSLYILVKNSFNFKLGFFHLFWIYFRGYHEEKYLHSGYHWARWY